MSEMRTLLEQLVFERQNQHHQFLGEKFGHSTPTLKVLSGLNLEDTFIAGASGGRIQLLLNDGYQNIRFKNGGREILGVPDHWEKVDLRHRGVWHLVRLALSPGSAVFSDTKDAPRIWPTAHFTDHHHAGPSNPDYPYAFVLFDATGAPREFGLIAYSCHRRTDQ